MSNETSRGAGVLFLTTTRNVSRIPEGEDEKCRESMVDFGRLPWAPEIGDGRKFSGYLPTKGTNDGRVEGDPRSTEGPVFYTEGR